MKRVFGSLVTLFLASLVAFFLVNALPGNTAQSLLGPDATADQVATFEKRLGLDQPVTHRYFTWLTRTVHGDLGYSLASDQPVAGLLADGIAATSALIAYVFVLVVPCAVGAAVLVARWPVGVLSSTIRTATTAGLASASYVVAILLVLGLSVHWKVFPSFGYVQPTADFGSFLRTLTLPALSIALPLWSLYTRFLASDLQAQLRSKEYIWAAEARGIGRWRIIIRHALRSTLSAMLAVIGLHFSALLGGAVVIEQIFGIPGVGRLLVAAVELRDLPVVQAIVVWTAFVAIAFTFLANAASEFLDPRTRAA